MFWLVFAGYMLGAITTLLLVILNNIYVSEKKLICFGSPYGISKEFSKKDNVVYTPKIDDTIGANAIMLSWLGFFILLYYLIRQYTKCEVIMKKKT